MKGNRGVPPCCLSFNCTWLVLPDFMAGEGQFLGDFTMHCCSLRRAGTSALWCALALATLPLAAVAAAAETKPVAAKSTSSIAYEEKDGVRSVDITNVTFDVTGDRLPGRAAEERLVLRTTVHLKEVLDEAGVDSAVTVEAWTLGTDLGTRPAYSVALEGVGAATVDNGLLVVERGTGDVDWWTVHALGTGTALFDTYVPLAAFSITREVQTMRYAGLEVPPDDVKDERLREPHVVGVLSYAAADGVKREALITCDDADRATLLRSYWDETRTLAASEAAPAPSAGSGDDRPVILELSWSTNNPNAAPETVSARVAVAGDDLDLAGAQLPTCFRIADWQR
jgi:hypothetical protein